MRNAPAAEENARSNATTAARHPLLRASALTAASHAVSQLVRFASNVLLFRLLFPEAFGLMALVHGFVQALQMFSDIGLGPAIVASPHGNERSYLNTAWSLQVIRGIAIGLLCLVAAGPISMLYGEPALRTVLPVVGLGAVLQGLQSTRIFTAQRDLALGRITILELVAQAVSVLVMIAWALAWPSVWALVVGSLASALTATTLSHLLLPGDRPRFAIDRTAAKEIVRFGRWIFVSTLLTFVALHSDRLIFGMMVPLDRLGVYGIAVALASMPSSWVGLLMHRALFPNLSREMRAGRSLAEAHRRVHLPVGLLSGALYSCLFVVGPPLVERLYGERAVEAGWMLQILALGGFFSCLRLLGSAPLLALGQPRILAFAHGAKVSAMLVLLPVGYALGGFPGAVLGLASADLASYAVVLASTARRGIGGLRRDALLSFFTIAATGGGVILASAIRDLHLGEEIAIAAASSVLLLGWSLVYEVTRRAMRVQQRRWSTVVPSA